MDIPDLIYPIYTKTLEPLSKGHHNGIRIFNSYFHFWTYHNDPIGNDWVKVANDDSNKFCITCYDYFRRLRMTGIVNTRNFSTTLYYKPYSPVDNLKISIEHDSTFIPSIKYQSPWDNQSFNSIATACTKYVEVIFHRYYGPSTSDDKAKIKEKQKISVLSF